MKTPRRFIAALLVIVLLAVPLASCKTAEQKGTSAFKKTSRTITALYVAGSGKEARGGTSRVKVTVEPNPSKSLRIGFYESDVGGSGSMWRSAGWMSAVVGTFILGQELSDYRFTYDVGGKIDGPSAGGLMTTAVIASILGDKIKKDITMTGTINPDGTIGPVGGIPQKLAGAKRAGKKTVLIPVGLRYSTDEATGEAVDVVEVGSEKGLKVKEVSDIYEAYKLLTGKQLPKLRGEKEGMSELPSGAFSKIKSKAKKFYADYLDYKNRYDGLAAENKTAGTDELMVLADADADQADGYLDEGLIAGAYNESFEAALYAAIAYQIGKTIERYRAGGLAAARESLKSDLAVKLKIDGVIDDFKTQKPETLSELMAISEAYGNLSTAYGLVDLGDEQISEEIADEGEALEAIAQAASYYALADTVADMAEDTVAFGEGFGKRTKVDQKKVERVARIFRKAAEANLDYFDNVVLNERAKSAGVSLDVARAAMIESDFDYRAAVSAISNLPALRKRIGSGPSRNYAVLGNSLISYQLTSGLVAKYYSLGAEEDENGNLVGISHEKAMTAVLSGAKQEAEESINAAKAAGAEPAVPIYYLEGANIAREGDLGDKLDSLYDFWMASTEARLMAMFGGAKIE